MTYLAAFRGEPPHNKSNQLLHNPDSTAVTQGGGGGSNGLHLTTLHNQDSARKLLYSLAVTFLNIGDYLVAFGETSMRDNSEEKIWSDALWDYSGWKTQIVIAQKNIFCLASESIEYIFKHHNTVGFNRVVIQSRGGRSTQMICTCGNTIKYFIQVIKGKLWRRTY